MRTSAGFSWMLLAVSVLLSATANANPTGPQVASGTATLQQSGSLLQITNTPNAIINWQSFSIGVNEITRFVQQSASSAVLNRVVTRNPSSILGALQSNGRVFLINPSGIVFGAGAQIDVAGLVASTLNLSDQDFLAGRLRFTETPGAGAVVNQGAINAAGGGVYLVGPSVTNGGVISNPQGEVILAAGKSVELVEPGTPNLRVEISAPDSEALNLGQILASSGRIGIFGGLIRSSGTLNADRAVAGPAGEILLKATTSVALESGILSAASGTIRIEAGQNVNIDGPIFAAADQLTILSGQSASLGRISGDFRACPTWFSQGCGNSPPPPPPIVIVDSGSAITVNNANPALTGSGNITVDGGVICPASLLQGCGSLASPPSINIVASGSGSITVNDATISPAVSGNMAVNGSNLTAIAVAFDNAARVLQLGAGQIVGSVQATSQINDLVKTLGGSAVGGLTAPHSSPTSE